jgi:hypothetical protein
MNDSEKTEYDACFKMLSLYTASRRQDMTIVAAAQAAVLTVVGGQLLSMQLEHFLLSLVALFVTVMGLNADRRHSAYMYGYIKRARAIEDQNGMELLKQGYEEVKRTKCLVSNSITFPIYYAVFASLWLIVWLLNIFR